MTRSVTAAGTTDYVYAGDGMRVSKTTGSNVTGFAWDSRSSVPELVQDGDDFYIYGPGGLPVERIGASPKRFVMVDETGSVTMSTDSSGAVASSRSFDVWGNETAHTGTPVSLGWQSQYQDSETGFYYLRNRYYDPVTGQFTTPDPLFSLTGDRYGYAGDDPLNYTDPLGMFGYGTIASDFGGITGGLGPLLEDIGEPVGRFITTHATQIGIAAAIVGTAGLIISTGGLGVLGVEAPGILGVGFEVGGLTLGAASTASDCVASGVDGRCFMDLVGLATGGAGIGLGRDVGLAGRLMDVDPEIATYVGGLADGVFGIWSVGYGLAAVRYPGAE